jgi:hypothetical protein
MLALAKNKEINGSSGQGTLYGAIANLACINGADAETVIGYVDKASAVDDDDALSLRARMFLKLRRFEDSLNDLEKVMANRGGHALTDGGVDPHKSSTPCGWSLSDFEAFGDAPRALSAKAYYLSSFLAFGAQSRGTVKESEVRGLYMQSSKTWRSPIPFYLASGLNGLGTEQSTAGSRCMRKSDMPDTVRACTKYDDGIRQQIRDLTMALMIDPKFTPALAARANAYLKLAQASYADNKPSKKFYELAIGDYTAALDAGARERNMLLCDRALALAAVGRYEDAASGYEQGMKYAKNGVEESPFVYRQLAGVYFKMGRFEKAADTITHAIMNVSGGGMDVVIFSGGIRGFRLLYPEYDLLPDEVLAEVVRRKYYPNFPAKWNGDFISKLGRGAVISSILPELYVIRGDAYMKAGLRKKALADYKRVKGDAWGVGERLSPGSMYFDDIGRRIADSPEVFPPPMAKF